MGTAAIIVKEERIPYPKDTPIHTQVYEALNYPAHYHRGSLELIYRIAGSATIQAGFEATHLRDGNRPPQGEEPMRRIQDLILSAAWRRTAPDDDHGSQAKQAANRLMALLLEYFDLYYYKKTTWDPNNIMRDRFYLSQSIRNSAFLRLSRILGFIRCCRAEELLLTTERPILEISAMCGFSDLKYFSHHFDAWWGCTSHQHRINHLE